MCQICRDGCVTCHEYVLSLVGRCKRFSQGGGQLSTLP
jgi:hypothetical protein